jgi:hypothetical protein
VIEGAPHGLSQKSNRDEVPKVVVRECEAFFPSAGKH